MDKMTKIISYLPELALFALTVRSVALGAGIGDALAIISLVSYIGYSKYLTKAKIEDKAELDKKYDELAAQVQSLSMDKALRRQVSEPKAQVPRKLF